MTAQAIGSSRGATERPPAITWAVIITVVSNIVLTGLFLFPLPGADKVPAAAIVVGSVMTVITLALCWWIWNLKKRVAITFTIVTLLNLISSFPAFFDPPGAVIIAIIIVSIPATLIPIWLLWHPTARRAYR
ncbi:hypothetical protein AYO38_10895 [bacterium SCGC AG-212-C10]|nr:hypothetical protein AYO38_10895 [bacterium SCGC AG-212-C10]